MPYDVEYEGETKYPKITPERIEGARGLDRLARRNQERGLRIAQVRQQRGNHQTSWSPTCRGCRIRARRARAT